MTEQDKKDMRQIFNEGFEAIVLPHIEELQEGQQRLEERQSRLEERQSQLEERQSELEKGQDRIESTVDQIAKVQEQEVTRSDHHERRIERLEHDRSLARAA